ncbi:MAG: DUF3458 domain-containing protein [Chloroflexi bacterium]|nr:DUF3458 domain-containing protein [Chloroflexota bacterium]
MSHRCERFLLGCGAGEQAARSSRPFPLPGDRVHYAPDRSFKVHHIKIELRVDLHKKHIAGEVTHTVAAINDGLRKLEFHARELDVKGVRLDGGRKLSFDYDGDKLTAYLPRPRKANRKFQVIIAYAASPRKGMYFVGPDAGYPNKPWQAWTQGEDEDSRYWFPCHDFPDERASTEVLATVPASFFALSNGKLLGVKANRGKTKTYHWYQAKPHVAYLTSLAVGEFAEMKDKVDGIPLAYYVPKGRQEDAKRALGNTPDMMRFFNERLGLKYPWDKYAQVCVADFIFGGMENVSATTLTDIALHDERAHLDFSGDPLVAHELAHQWFGDLITCQNWAHAWLNEGFATYFEALYTEHHRGKDEFVYEMYQNGLAYQAEDAGRYRRPIVQKTYREPIDLFDRHLYEKASWVLHMLRFVLGEELFWKAIRHYARKHQATVVTTPDLQQAIGEATGRSLEWFFDQWVYQAGHPQFKVQYAWDADASTAKLTVTQTQATDDQAPIFRMPVDVAFVLPRGKSTVKETVRVQVSEKEHSFYFPLRQKPLMAAFDYGNWILKTVDLQMPKDMLSYQLEHDDDAVGKVLAAKALGKLGTPEAVDKLKAAVQSDAFWGVQAEAALALGAMKSEAARQALLECLEVKHPKARKAVVAALGEFKHESVVDALAPMLKRDASYFVEAEAAKSIGRTKSPRAYELLEKALAKESYADVIRMLAFEGFGELKDERAIALAKEWSAYGKPPRAREAAIAALGKLGEDKREVREHLEELLEDPAFRVKLQTAVSLRDVKDDRAVPALQRIADRELDGRIVRRARETIAALREGKDKGAEVKKLRDDLNKVMDENRQLKDRLDKLETASKPSKGKPTARKKK